MKKEHRYQVILRGDEVELIPELRKHCLEKNTSINKLIINYIKKVLKK